MTILGKILTFVVLVLALAQVALHVMFHVTRTNWVTEYNKLAQRYDVAEHQRETYRQERDDAVNKSAEEVKKAQAERDEQAKKVVADVTTINNLQMQLAAVKDQVTKGDANVTGAVTDTQRRDEEVKRLITKEQANTDRIKELLTQNNQLRDRAVGAEIESKSLKDRNGNLVNKLEEMSKELVKAKTSGGSLGTSLTARNPPAENVEGQVTKTDASGLLTLSIGSDAGLTKGNTMEVFRLSPAKYLGTVRILSVTPHEAVAQPVSRPLGQIQQGDRVASKILGS